MLGYSTIAHAGYVMLGLATMREGGYGAAIFYIVGFMAMNLVAFLVIYRVSPEGRNPLIHDLAGLHSRSPLAALILAGSMFALAGIPPFVGFIGKFRLMAEALDRGLVTLVVLAAVNTAIGVYYYLNVVRVIYFEEAGALPAVRLDRLEAVLGVVLFLAVVVLGILPAPLLDAAVAAVRGLK
jgi:NADH-quinone oxidoreductase subunit N